MNDLLWNPEIVRIKLEEVLTGDRPDEQIEYLERTGLLKVILPEVVKLKGVKQPKEFHPEGDVWNHTLLVLKEMNHPHFELAMAALLHDVGKPSTFSIRERIRFDNHAKIGTHIAKKILVRLEFSDKQIDYILFLIKNHMRFIGVKKLKKSKLRSFLKSENFPDLLELHKWDCLASNEDLSNYDFCCKKLEEFSKEKVKPKPIISGRDLIRLGFRPGPIFKDILMQIKNATLDGKITNKEEAVKFIERNNYGR